MNERIRELVEQAQYYANEQNDKHGVSWIRTYNEKFAELIVQECIDNVKVWEKDSRNHISYMLKNHFGVEE
jgi:hypothetical protein